MSFPTVPSTVFTERDGVLAVAATVNDARCLWRETPMHDVGIDGQIEHISISNEATGRLVFVQVKAGESYFTNATPDVVTYAPSEKHRNYWEQALLPVILIMHRPSVGTFWTDARKQLRQRKLTITVPFSSNFGVSGVLASLASDGPLPAHLPKPRDLMLRMLREKNTSNAFPIDMFDLFVHGLMDLARSVFFSVDLAYQIAHSILAERGRSYCDVGHTEYTFFRRYVQFLIAYDLARVDFDAFTRSWEDEVVPDFIAPLTRTGFMLRDYISSIDNSAGIRVSQDKIFVGIASFEIERRVPVVSLFKDNVAAQRI